MCPCQEGGGLLPVPLGGVVGVDGGSVGVGGSVPLGVGAGVGGAVVAGGVLGGGVGVVVVGAGIV